MNKHINRLIISEKIRFLVGIDEAGRGALAGPVAVGMFVWPLENGRLNEALTDYPAGRDSKKLTPKMREKWFSRIMDLSQQNGAVCQVSFVSHKYIDRAGIVPAVWQGIKSCLAKLTVAPNEVLILLDGGLKAPDIFINQETIVRGDETELAISLASILAKVSRDRKMIALAETCADYGFAKHKGYGTKEHYNKIKQKGASIWHRQTYLH